jgi:hypothetical protein
VTEGVLSEDELVQVLDAAGFQNGDRFELRALRKPSVPGEGQKSEAMPGLFVHDEHGVRDAVTWLDSFNASLGWEFYVGTNPIRKKFRQKYPKHAPHDVDVEEVRLLLIDTDPGRPGKGKDEPVTDEEIAAVPEATQAVYHFLCARFGVKLPLIGSGRGRHIYVLHDPYMPEFEPYTEKKTGATFYTEIGENALLRKHLLATLGHKFGTTLTHIDPKVFNPSRIMRLPFSVNLKTGKRGSILEPGEKKVVPLSALRELLRDLEAEQAREVEVASDPIQVNTARLVAPPRIPNFTNEQAALRRLYEGCAVMRECWKLQESGTKLHRGLWCGSGTLLLKIGDEGEKELRRLDLEAVGFKDEEYVEKLIETAARCAPTRCSALVNAVRLARKHEPSLHESLKDICGSPSSGCGTTTNPCGFRLSIKGGTPFTHTYSEPVTLKAVREKRDAVEDRMRAKIREFFSAHDGRTLLVRSEAGLGKTTQAMKSIVASGVKVAWFAPTRKLLHQTRKNFEREIEEAKSALAVGVRPKITKKLCPAKLSSLVDYDYQVGINPKNSVCETCDYYRGEGGEEANEKCPYVTKLKRFPKKDVRLYPSAMLKFDWFVKKLKDTFIVFDEDPTQYISPTLTKNQKEMKDLVGVYLKATRNATGKAQKLLEQRYDLLSWLERRMRRAKDNKERVVVLRAKDFDVEKPIRSRKALSRANGALRGVLNKKTKDEDADIEKVTTDGKRVSAETSFFAGFVNYIFRLVQEKREDVVVGIIDRVNTQDGESTLVLNYRIELPRGANVLVLDATATPEHYRALLDREIEEVGGFVDHQSALVQLADKSFSISSLAKTRPLMRDYAARVVKAILDEKKPESAVVITHKKRRPALRKLLGITKESLPIAHFMSVRGLNKYQDRRLLVVLGTPRPPFSIIRGTAAFLHGATRDDLEKEAKQSKLMYRGCTVRPHAFANEKLRLASEYHVQSELIQAIGRNRYARPEKRDVYILTNEVIDIPDVKVGFARWIYKLPPPEEGIKAGDLQKRLDRLSRFIDDVLGTPGKGYTLAEASRATQIPKNDLARYHELLDEFYDLSDRRREKVTGRKATILRIYPKRR